MAAPPPAAADRLEDLLLPDQLSAEEHPGASIAPVALWFNLRPMHRFFAPARDPGDETVLLPRDEGEHLTRVLRLGVGDMVAVFDGRGHEWIAKIASVLRRDVRVQLVSRTDAAAEPQVGIPGAQAVLNGDTTDDWIR